MGQPPRTVEQRLDKLEQKIDLILQELRRMGASPKQPKGLLPKGPGTGTRPVDPNTPRPIPRVEPGTPQPPAPPTPPSPPVNPGSRDE
jgi:hypothetical protein